MKQLTIRILTLITLTQAHAEQNTGTPNPLPIPKTTIPVEKESKGKTPSKGMLKEKNEAIPGKQGPNEESNQEPSEPLGNGGGQGSENNNMEDPRVIRIQELLPGMLTLLPIHAAVPDNFIAASNQGQPDLYQGLFWGDPTTLRRYFDNPDEVRGPIFKVQLSPNVIQEGPETFLATEEADAELDLKKLVNINMRKTLWGRYPVLVLTTADAMGFKGYYAWVGLNKPEGWTLRFSLVTPTKTKDVPQRYIDAWETFLDKTEELPHNLFYNALSEELNPGSTYFSIEGAKIKALAERRLTDGQLLIAVEPLNDQTSYALSEYEEVKATTPWNEGKLMVKIDGQIAYQNQKTSLVIKNTLAVLVKDVIEFSEDYKALKENPKNIVILQRSKFYNENKETINPKKK